MRRRIRAAEKTIARTLESVLFAPENANLALAPSALSTTYDSLIADESAACVNAVAARFPDAAGAIQLTEASASAAVIRGRPHALRYINAAAGEQLKARDLRGRPLPERLARRGVALLFSGGVLWRGWYYVTTHWPQIAAHLPHVRF
jgi:hypothetical protein